MGGSVTDPLVCVVVLSWNRQDETLACLASLRPLLGLRRRAILVDNGSEDGTPDAAAVAFPEIEVLRNERNLGFAAGNNVGIRRALTAGADYVALLNDDTVVDPGYLEALVSAAGGDPRAGFLSSTILSHERRDEVWFAGASLSLLTGRSRHLGAGRLEREISPEIRETDRPCTCSMLVSRRLLEEVGLMEERLFLYAEELDWALRARKMGFHALVVPSSRVWHRLSTSTGCAPSGDAHYYSVRNTLSVLAWHAPLRPGFLNEVRAALVVGAYIASLFTMGIPKCRGLGRILRGVRDYRRGVLGPLRAADTCASPSAS